MPDWSIRQGDVLDRLREMPDESVHCCVTSPPYWGLRDYGVDGAYGLEPTLDEYIERMVEVFREVRRVLRKDGTLWLNLGDAYAGSGKGMNADGTHPVGAKQETNIGSLSAPVKSKRMPRGDGRWGGGDSYVPELKPKDLCGLPWRVAFALQADGWWLRSEIVWAKPNPMPESVRDRPTSSHEFVFLLTKSGSPTYWTHRDGPGTRTKPPPDHRYVHRETSEERAEAPEGWDLPDSCWRRVNLWRGHDYFYDAEAIKEPPKTSDARADASGMVRSVTDAANPHFTQGAKTDKQRGHSRRHAGFNGRWDGMTKAEQAMGSNKLDVWWIATQGFPGAHFATFPEKLVEPCILAGTSERGVCGVTGDPWERVVEQTGHVNQREPTHVPGNTLTKTDSTGWAPTTSPTDRWQPTCDHDSEPVPAIVLDPFCGSGTTGVVALRHGRSFVGIELNPEYVELARQRVIDDAPLFHAVAEVVA